MINMVLRGLLFSWMVRNTQYGIFFFMIRMLAASSLDLEATKSHLALFFPFFFSLIRLKVIKDAMFGVSSFWLWIPCRSGSRNGRLNAQASSFSHFCFMFDFVVHRGLFVGSDVLRLKYRLVARLSCCCSYFPELGLRPPWTCFFNAGDFLIQYLGQRSVICASKAQSLHLASKIPALWYSPSLLLICW